MSADRFTFADALRSKWATSPRVFLALAPLLIFGVWARTNQALIDAEPLKVLAVAVSAPLIGLMILLLARPVMLRNRAPQQVRPVWVVLLWVSIGVAMGLVNYVGRAYLLAFQGTPFLGRYVLNVAFTVVAMGILTFAVAAVEFQRGQLRDLEVRGEALQRLRTDAEVFALEQQASLAEAIQVHVLPELERLRAEVSGLGDTTSIETIETLRAEVSEYAQQVIRPMSHDIAESRGLVQDLGNAERGVRGVGMGLWATVRGTHPTAALVLLAAFTLGLTQFTPECAFPILPAILVTSLVLLLGAAVQQIPWFATPPRGFVLLIGFAILGYAVYQSLLTHEDGRCSWVNSPSEWVVGSIVFVVVVTAVATMVQASQDTRQSVAAVAEANARLVEAARTLQFEGMNTREQIAQVLHGPVQGRFAAISLALRMHLDAVERGEQPSIDELARRITGLLDDASIEVARLLEPQEGPPPTLAERLAAAGEQWRGLLTITSTIDDAVTRICDEDAVFSAQLGECVDEAITNASRHGRARMVDISLRYDTTALGVVLNVTDDGVGPTQPVSPGLGLQRIASNGGTWSLEGRSHGGSQLVVMLPVANPVDY